MANTKITTSVIADGAITSAKLDTDISVSGLTVDTNTLHVDATNNRVGIGTTSPSAKLDVYQGELKVTGTLANWSVDSQGVVMDFTRATTSYIRASNAAGQLQFQTGGSNNRMIINSSGNVGIGTTSPSSDISGTATVLEIANSNLATLVLNNTSAASWEIASTVNSDLVFNNGTTRATIDSSGNVGIGATPSSTIRNDITSAEKALQIGNRAMFFSDGGVTTDLQNNSHLTNSDTRVAMQTDAGSLYQQYQGVHKWFNAASVSAGATQTMTERMRIDASGNVTIGSSSLSANAALKFQADTGTFTLEHERGSHALTLSDSDGTGEILRVDTSGNLLVGTTSTSASVAGGRIFSTGRLVTSVNNEGHYFRRNSSDGTIIEFAKDSTTVGSIGAYGGASYIGGNLNGSIYFNGNTDVRPFDKTSLANYDNQLNLGGTTSRWKDLYLSGGAYIGGTGSANKLDDYEEGTWTPAVGGNGLVTTGYARYTKIGNLVQADCEITLANQTSANQMAISGLPFYISEDAAGIIAYTTSSTVSNTILGQATSMFFYTSGSTISTLANYSGSFIRAQITYRTTS